MKLNPDGLSIAIGDRNGNIRIYDMQTFKQIALVEAHDSEVLSVDYGQSTDWGLYSPQNSQLIFPVDEFRCDISSIK